MLRESGYVYIDNEMGYADGFAHLGLPVVKIGINIEMNGSTDLCPLKSRESSLIYGDQPREFESHKRRAAKKS